MCVWTWYTHDDPIPILVVDEQMYPEAGDKMKQVQSQLPSSEEKHGRQHIYWSEEAT
jgi:hypothetical protein